MADKPEFVDTISQATRQRWRREETRVVEVAPVVEERSRLSHWPPKGVIEWRMETFTPWRIKAWRQRLWGSK
jgi:hypothetical protein